jgi:hypothetical protein
VFSLRQVHTSPPAWYFSLGNSEEKFTCQPDLRMKDKSMEERYNTHLRMIPFVWIDFGIHVHYSQQSKHCLDARTASPVKNEYVRCTSMNWLINWLQSVWTYPANWLEFSVKKLARVWEKFSCKKAGACSACCSLTILTPIVWHWSNWDNRQYREMAGNITH